MKTNLNGKKGQAVGTVVKLVLALAVIGMMIFIGYKYILGTGETIGGLSECEGQGGKCVDSDDECAGVKLPNLCKDNTLRCCIKT